MIDEARKVCSTSRFEDLLTSFTRHAFSNIAQHARARIRNIPCGVTWQWSSKIGFASQRDTSNVTSYQKTAKQKKRLHFPLVLVHQFFGSISFRISEDTSSTDCLLYFPRWRLRLCLLDRRFVCHSPTAAWSRVQTSLETLWISCTV